MHFAKYRVTNICRVCQQKLQISNYFSNKIFIVRSMCSHRSDLHYVICKMS